MAARRRVACWVALAFAVACALPAGAAASSRQFSILQDDRTLLGSGPHDPDRAMGEARALGVDMVRAFVSWRRVSPRPDDRRIPAGFDPANPDSPGYDWTAYDGFVERARRQGLKVFLTLAPPIPNWASQQPRRCPHLVGGYPDMGRSCMWKPDPRLFGRFARAVARRYRGRVQLYSIWNEPNLEHYLYPQLQRTRHGIVDVAAKRYRELWWAGWRAIAAEDPAMRKKVLFGETAAISSPMDTLYAALCLDERGRPFRGRLKALHGCNRPRKMPIGGIAHHPYTDGARGTLFQRTDQVDALFTAYVGRLSGLMGRAARLGRIPRRLGIYLTESGFQSNPPDRREGLSLGKHAKAVNDAERLFFGDPRVRSVAQYTLYDVPQVDQYNTGLRRADGRPKPALGAYRMPIVVTALARRGVEVWGQVRPAHGRVAAEVELLARSGGQVRATLRVATNASGYFRLKVRRRDAARLRYRARWRTVFGDLTSRVARPGRPVRYFD